MFSCISYLVCSSVILTINSLFLAINSVLSACNCVVLASKSRLLVVSSWILPLSSEISNFRSSFSLLIFVVPSFSLNIYQTNPAILISDNKAIIAMSIFNPLFSILISKYLFINHSKYSIEEEVALEQQQESHPQSVFLSLHLLPYLCSLEDSYP